MILETFSRVIIKTPLHYDEKNMLTTNNSYGAWASSNFCESFLPPGAYNSRTASIDLLSRDYNEVLHIIAAGNSGKRTCAPYAQ
jgi:hypothetical protein